MSMFSLVCSGQGAQSPDLFTRFPFTEKGLSLKQRVLAAGSLEPDVAAWLTDPSSDPDAVFQNHFSQPLLCLYQLMVWAELESLLPAPAMVAGYSLGELTAYGCVGAIAPGEIVRLAGLRARLMDGAGPEGRLIATTGLTPERAAALDGAHVAIVISGEHCVIGCLASRAESLAEELKSAGARDATILAVTVASHTPILDAAVEPFRTALSQAAAQPLSIPVLAGINASKVTRPEQIAATLPEQIHQTIRWDRIQRRFQESGCRVILELGPGNQLAHMALSHRLEARGVDEFRTPQGVATWIQSTLARLG
jgi:[acyl-carrier-protein] S-malonyltransferase